jgi:2-phospho-L-lactate guanylyltransferase (CobY/MobA/RfbA family)
LSGAERTGGVVGFLTDIFDSAKHTTIDNVCKVAPSAAAIASGTEVKVKKEKKKKHHKSDQATESLEIESAS